MQRIFFFLFLAIGPLFASLDNMSLDEKVGQLLIAHFHGDEANEEAQILINQVCIGGIIYYEWANGLSSPSQVQELSNGLQKLAREGRSGIPLFISVDQEGGRVCRLKSGFTVFPSNWTIGQAQDPQLAERCAYAMGTEMRAVGINVNFAPVVDVNSNPQNPVIGTRSYSSSSEVVAEFAQCALNGYHRARVISTLKHFPGHGDVTSDSHDTLPILDKSKEELLCVELYPYQRLIQDADMVMTAHILVHALDADACATFSQKILRDLLRSELGFQGVVISDSLIMKGAMDQNSSIEEAAMRAFNAGCDILLFGGRQLVGKQVNHELTAEDIARIHRFLVNAVKEGQISEERLDASVKRILDLKSKYGLFNASLPTEKDIVQYVHTEENQRLANGIGS